MTVPNRHGNFDDMTYAALARTRLPIGKQFRSRLTRHSFSCTPWNKWHWARIRSDCECICENNRARGVSAPANTPRAQFDFFFRLRKTCASRPPLIPLKQIPRVYLVRHVREPSLQRLATITSQPALKASRSWVTSEPKNSGASSVGS